MKDDTIGPGGSERHPAADASAQRVLTLSRAIEQSGSLVVIADTHGHIEYVNPKFTEVTGYTLAEVVGRNPSLWKSGETPMKEYARLWETLRAGGEWRGEFRNRKKDGGLYWALASISPVRNAAGIVTHFVAVEEDITERKEAEQRQKKLNEDLALSQRKLLKTVEELQSAQMRLIEAEKLETVGRLAAGVAHEVKNPLAVIHLGLEYLLREHGGRDGETSQVLNDMAGAVHRAGVVIGDLLNLSAAKQLALQPVHLNGMLDQCLTMLHVPAAATRVHIAREFAPDLPPVPLDSQKIEQVFLNLCINAFHAMPDGGTLTVRTLLRQLDPAEAHREPGSRSGAAFRPGDTVVVVEVDDTGAGIPDDVLPRIFDPFFTTKPTGKGTGLGLTVSKKIVQLHGGRLRIHNRPEGGVRATVLLKA
ncbi:MAG: PAS domain S-box protein [Verrucomicrobia bacterium]|nr:PAS domain S-box protein [Verrucomicrobiota bacterium]